MHLKVQLGLASFSIASTESKTNPLKVPKFFLTELKIIFSCKALPMFEWVVWILKFYD